MVPWGSFFHPRDARGHASRTLWFVTVAFVLLSLRFIVGGMLLDLGWFKWDLPATALIDYGAATAAIVAVWVGREAVWSNKNPKKDSDG